MHGTTRKAALFLGVFLTLGSLGYILHGSALLAPSSGTWAPTPGVLSEARSGAAAAALSDGRVLVTGGDGAAGSPVASVEVFGLDGSFVICRGEVVQMIQPPADNAPRGLAATILDFHFVRGANGAL